MALAERLPSEAAEALLSLAIGEKPQRPVLAAGRQPRFARPLPQPSPESVTTPSKGSGDADEPPSVEAFQHPDAQRRFRLIANSDELARALEFPWEKWIIFLHPDQRKVVERNFNGPARVAGSAGTGKTIVALHRAVYLARSHPDARVLLTTFSDTLAHALERRCGGSSTTSRVWASA